KRAEEKRNRPPTRAQQRSFMCTYLKNMEGWTPKSLKNKSFANIQELFEKAMKRVNTFIDYRAELIEESSKKAGKELEESTKKAEVEIAQESSKRVISTDISEITRKQSKMGKHGHENHKSTKRSQRFKVEARKVKPAVKVVKSCSTKVNKTHNNPFSPSKFHQSPKITPHLLMGPRNLIGPEKP
ncbi:hypothetical protein Tco_0170615, partial [Tanacetum coccineum]